MLTAFHTWLERPLRDDEDDGEVVEGNGGLLRPDALYETDARLRAQCVDMAQDMVRRHVGKFSRVVGR
eukprot:10574-Eustigmatos_ZCMA.PRE.1